MQRNKLARMVHTITVPTEVLLPIYQEKHKLYTITHKNNVHMYVPKGLNLLHPPV